jgi:RNA polymerase sigma factor (sigma-70 family)
MKSRAVRLPAQRLAQLRALARANEELAASLRRVPTREEVAAKLGVTVDEVIDLEELTGTPASLSAPVGENDAELGDVIPDDAEPSPETVVESDAERAALERLVDSLPDRAALVVRMHYGLDGAPPATFDEIAARLGVTRERVRQIEQRALLHIRHDVESRLAVA